MDAIEEYVMKKLATSRASVDGECLVASTESDSPFRVSPGTYATSSIALLLAHSAE